MHYKHCRCCAEDGPVGLVACGVDFHLRPCDYCGQKEPYLVIEQI